MARHPHADVIKAWAEGAEIEWSHSALCKWNPVTTDQPVWRPDTLYRVKPKPDPYAALKEAYARGETIQLRWANSLWEAIVSGPTPSWGLPVSAYRVKPKPDPYAKLKAAYARGETIEYGLAPDTWVPFRGAPSWTDPVSNYRVKPKPDPDPYAELKAAYARGETIQLDTRILAADPPRWEDMSHAPSWTARVSEYRVKPELLKVKMKVKLKASTLEELRAWLCDYLESRE